MSPANILVADDGKVMRLVLSTKLKEVGYSVTEAEDGHEVLQAVSEQSFDLIVLDIHMPGMNGIDALKELRKTHSRIQLPVIMATANDEEEDVVEAFELGANDFVSKPINFPILLARLDTQLRLKRATEELEKLAGGSEG